MSPRFYIAATGFATFVIGVLTIPFNVQPISALAILAGIATFAMAFVKEHQE